MSGNVVTKEMILAGLRITKAAVPGYGASLEGPRTRGSTTERGLDSLPCGYTATLAGSEPGILLFDGDDGGLGGKLGAAMLSEVADCEKVCARIGAHGPELYIDRALRPNIESGRLTFIMAGEGHPDLPPGGLITWFPGLVMGCLNEGHKKDIEGCLTRGRGRPEIRRSGYGYVIADTDDQWLWGNPTIVPGYTAVKLHNNGG